MDWIDWRNKLTAVDHPNARSLDEKSVKEMLFRPSKTHKELILWTSRKIVERLGCVSPDSDLVTIFSSFVFGSPDTIAAFIDGTHNKTVMENIWKCILNDLRPCPLMEWNTEIRGWLRRTNFSTISVDELEALGITGPPPDTSPRQPDILDDVDDIIDAAEALLAKFTKGTSAADVAPSVVEPCSSPTCKFKQGQIRPLSKLLEEAEKLEKLWKTESQEEHIGPAVVNLGEANTDLEELLDEFKTMNAVIMKMKSHGISGDED